MSAEPTGPRRPGRAVTVVTALAAAGAVTVAVLAGAVMLLAAAMATPTPTVFVAAGAATFLVVDALGAALVARRTEPRRRRMAGWSLFASSVGLALVASFVVALAPAPMAPAAGPAGSREVGLADGSWLSVLRLPARGAAHGPPIVVLHGGPGIPDLAANTAALAPLTAQGRDVYVYAQRGSDGSARLPDPRGYSRDRDVIDLETLRSTLALDRMVLLGHSHGADVAAAYTAAHREHVERLVLVSPGPLDPADTSPTRATADLDLRRKIQQYAHVLAPRPLLGYLLLQVNPRAAHAFLGDKEADARNDAVLTLAEPALFCHGPPPGLPPVTGSGFYALQYPQSTTAFAPIDIRPALTGLPTPTLIVKGGCDYQSWRSAIDYRNRLPHADLLYLPDAGHNAQQDQPAAFLAAVTAFLHDQAVPGDLITNDAVPPGYRGPP